MKSPAVFRIFALSTLLPITLAAQPGYNAVDDTVCIFQGQPFTFNVTTNDQTPAGVPHFVQLLTPSSCFALNEVGDLSVLPSADDCCGDHQLVYRYTNCQPSAPGGCAATVFITVKCGKPDCFLVNLEDFIVADSAAFGGASNAAPCAYACENSQATYFVSYNPNNTYAWTVTGGTFSPGVNPAQIAVNWGAQGAGAVSVAITDANNVTTVLQVCVDILQGPTAGFMPSASSICLNGTVSLANTSTNATSYFWDFGDGATSTLPSPSHTYNTAGTYTACLIATRQNYDAMGMPLCCCSDTLCQTITVDDLPGPTIECISTLCAGDEACYWTDVPGCSAYTWTVLDANGNPVPFTGQGTDTICVQWGNGPFGTITLAVSGCPGMVCTQPVTATIPIISPTAPISGPVTVCTNTAATYSVPKWLSVNYIWSITGGTIVGGQGTNTVSVVWGPAGTGTLTVNYSSPFLGGLPGHEPGDCAGTASLTIAIKPAFAVTMTGSNVVCRNTSTTFTATAAPSASYTWTISPALPFTGQGTNTINVTWSGSTGTYVVTAVPLSATAYCNASVSRVIQVVQTPPPTGIDGPVKICPGAMSTYYAQSAQSGVTFVWAVTGGTPAVFVGNPLTVTWNPTGPYGVGLQQVSTAAPNCPSAAVNLTVMPRLLQGPLTITGSPACINTTANYSVGPAQDPDAIFTWSITPANAGSVVGGQGTPNVQVQWNNLAGAATLSVSATLCNATLTSALPLTVGAVPIPVITQAGVLCPGSTATLNAGAGYASYQWSGGLNPTAQVNTINAAGAYVVTVSNAAGCTALGTFQANAATGPVASITTPGPTVLCIVPPNNTTVTLQALTGAGYSFAWSCNGGPVLPPATAVGATLTHQNTNVVGTFAYRVTVTDANGCTNASNIITITQTNNCGSPPACNPVAYSLSFTAANQTPNCNIVNFAVAASANVTVTGWNFGDPGGNANTGTLPNATHTYTQAGCFPVTVTAEVPRVAPPPNQTCTVTASGSVCVPVAANFTCNVTCQTVQFTNLSSWLPTETVSAAWNFGDGNTSNAFNPVNVYALPGTYTVTLTMSTAAGCQAVFTKNVVVPPPPMAAITVNPVMPCAGNPAQFTATGPGIISWQWNFGDGASNGSPSPAHAYALAGTYTVALTVTNAQGCTGTAMQTVVVKPLPPAGTITASGPLSICAGQSVTLTAPAGTGYTYLWSTLATSPSITVSTAGNYGVTITDANGCTAAPDSVTVIVNPSPPAFITGNPVICDAGCTLLTAPGGYSYVWLGPGNVPLAPPETGPVLQVCSANLLGSYAVSVTDANGCTAISPPVTVTVATSPSFALTVSPLPACAGTPATITLAPVQPNVTYSWSTGATGPTITVLQAGTYAVVGVDTTSGCRDTANATVHPLPDLCLVPAGCYEACNPDTICGPDGLTAYQWNLNGAPITGATGQCLIVTQSGTYTLTGTNSFGCTAASDSLQLMVIDCACDALEASVEPLQDDSCCFSASYVNGYGPLYGLVISGQNTGLNFNLGSLDPALQVFSLTANSIALVAAAPATTLPAGALNNFLEFCLTNVQNQPQYVIFDWYDGTTFEIVCSDTLQFNCPVEPECLYVSADSMYCTGTEVTYSLTVCNPRDNDFAVGYIDLQPASPAGVSFSPMPILLSPALPPGRCTTLLLTITGPALEDSVFCFSLTAHDMVPNPAFDTSRCCMLDTVYCIPIPDCEPCDDIGVDAILETPGSEPGQCCVNLALLNSYAANYFTGIALCAPPGTTLTVNNPFGSGWITASYSPTMVVLQAGPPSGSTLPLGSFNLPQFCITTSIAPPQLLEVKWLQGDSVVCRDTVPLQCTPPCGYLTGDTVLCAPDGSWLYTTTLVNTSNVTMNEAHVVFTAPAGLSPYNMTIPLGALPPGGFATFTVPIGSPGMIGDTVCFTVALHQTDDDEAHLNCCNFYHCIVLPECLPVACLCGPEFTQQVAAGMLCTPLATPPFTYSFAPVALFNPACDTVTWVLGNEPFIATVPGSTAVTYTFPGPGDYKVCMAVVRIDDNGEICKEQVCKAVTIAPPGYGPDYDDVRVSPNPSDGTLGVQRLDRAWSGPALLRLFDAMGRLITEWQSEPTTGTGQLPVRQLDVPAGLYWLEIRTKDERWVREVLIWR